MQQQEKNWVTWMYPDFKLVRDNYLNCSDEQMSAMMEGRHSPCGIKDLRHRERWLRPQVLNTGSFSSVNNPRLKWVPDPKQYHLPFEGEKELCECKLCVKMHVVRDEPSSKPDCVQLDLFACTEDAQLQVPMVGVPGFAGRVFRPGLALTPQAPAAGPTASPANASTLHARRA